MDRGHRVWVLDDLSTGHREQVLAHGFTQARAGDRAAVAALLRAEKFDCVMHFAAKALVGESVREPEMYFENNVAQTERLLDEVLNAGIRRLIFSSTCAVFGAVGDQAIDEELPKQPINPYGESKLRAERLLEKLARERGLQAVVLRYFNAAGAEPGGRVGEWHDVETHLIPLVQKAALAGQPVRIFGQDYPTEDGTCVRDYVHVTDLARAHEAAMHRLLGSDGKGRFEAFNLGSEHGYSVRQVLDVCTKALGRAIASVVEPRRAGDPPRLVANSAKARRELGFKVELGLEEIVRSAWAWEQKHHARAKAVFLDRDGTINEDPGYLSDPAKLKLLPGVDRALARLRQAGFKLVVISNQSGVNRGIIPAGMLEQVHARLSELLAPAGGGIDRFELCVHRPDENCECRKPKPRLILDATQALGLDLSRSYMVGDKLSDLQAGRAAGCSASALVRTGDGARTERENTAPAADFTGDSLTEVVDWILARENAGS
jgi:UDP-glucose 4-epimerase